MTQKELERLKAESDPTYVTDREKAIAARIGHMNDDEDSMLHWIWNRINPNYKTYITKYEFMNFLMSDAEVRDVFNLRENEVAHIVEAIVTERPDALNFEEFEVS
jgi:hypothetical protein